MTQAAPPSPPSSSSPLNIDGASRLYGDELLSQLRDGWADLPTRTLFALAMGGLKVRMMRSVVTMLSIVFAIAFLTYTGLTNQLTFNVAAAARDLDSFQSVDPARVSAATSWLAAYDLISSMPVHEQVRLADQWGLSQIAPAAGALPKIAQQLQATQAMYDSVASQLAAVQADGRARGSVVASLRLRLAQLQNDVEQLSTQQQSLEHEVVLGQWVRRGGSDGDLQMQARLTQTLDDRYTSLIRQINSPGQLDDAELARADRLLDLVTIEAALEPVQVARLALEEEQIKRQAASLRLMLRRAGVSVDRTLRGDAMDTWLITMAMLTCAVGIANAMLMSVTERFREIGTMKCLGAQDGLVIKLFLLESAFLGVIGAGIGIGLGLLVAILSGVLQYGTFGLWHFPRLEAGKVLLLSVLGGVVLAVIGAVYPAFAASRMKPVDALRVDE